jgi:serine/threonine protein kinase
VIHGDIKSANVLLSEQRVAKISDLGTSRVASAALGTMGGTATSIGARGSPLWLVPEMVEDSDLAPSVASDVFSWAITTWEILTTSLPYHDAAGAMLVNVDKLKSRNDLVSGALRPDLDAIRPDAPRALVELLVRAWSSNPRSRLAMAAVAAQLEAILARAAAEGGAAAEDGALQLNLPGAVSP